jgi:hypothetical protein
METLRILFYTDSADISENLHLWGLTTLEKFIKLKLEPIVDIEISILNRHIDYKNGRKHKYQATQLRKGLLDQFDELWIFGALPAPANKPELTQAEIQDLTEWMKKGGVFITGDHSIPMGGATCKDPHASFVNLGSALGRQIPRVKELRAWDGPPTGCYEGPLASRDNFNTQEGNNPLTLDDTSLQVDGIPQQLYLIPPLNPHRLFWWFFDEKTHQMVYISHFPDHLHEGLLTFPVPAEPDWPAGAPAPRVVARGRDKRFTNKFIDLVSVFEGTKDAGRIVADSSFHHYININLVRIDGLDQGIPKPLSALDQIAQYYANLALWLAPRELRKRMGWSLFLWAAKHPDVKEDKGNSDEIVGRTALRALHREIGIANVHRLIEETGDVGNTKAIADVVGLVFVGRSNEPEVNINAEAALGAVIREYHHAFDELEVVDPASLRQVPNSPEIVFRALDSAFENAQELLDKLHPRFKAAAEALAE